MGGESYDLRNQARGYLPFQIFCAWLGKALLLTGYFNGVQWIGEVQCEAGRFTVCSDCEMEQQQTVYMRFTEDKIHRWQKG